ncbi:hypothetical protein DSO57_1027618 [Entomophthora muscae]|uniref:Uncharacterized protein n=1 Tax=Entomophthora muscae TaxID=34485 RepID=A0ACC2RSR8_9FUNG|nr:hypothetical protein DSO57_1027618 [Entomophthora muscae]
MFIGGENTTQAGPRRHPSTYFSFPACKRNQSTYLNCANKEPPIQYSRTLGSAIETSSAPNYRNEAVRQP